MDSSLMPGARDVGAFPTLDDLELEDRVDSLDVGSCIGVLSVTRCVFPLRRSSSSRVIEASEGEAEGWY